MAQLPLDQSIPRFKENEERVNEFVNGTKDETWLTSGNVELPTVARLIDQTYAYSNRVYFRTKALMDIAAADPDQVDDLEKLAQVTSDPNPANNGLWEWDATENARVKTNDPFELLVNNLNSAFVPLTREGSVSSTPYAFLRFVKAIVIRKARPGKIYKLGYFQNQSTTLSPVTDGFSIYEYNEDWSGQVQVVNRQQPVTINREVSKQTIIIKSETVEDLSIEMLVNPQALPPLGTHIRTTQPADPGYSWIVSPICYELANVSEQNNNPTFVPSTREGINSAMPVVAMKFVKNIVINNARPGKIYKWGYFQNQSTALSPVTDGFTIYEFDEDWSNTLQVISRFHEITIDRTVNKQSIVIESDIVEGLSVSMLLDPSGLPPIGTQIRTTLPADPGYSWYVSKTQYRYADASIHQIKESFKWVNDEAHLFALTDSNGLYSQIRARKTDGKIPDDVLADWAIRMRDYIGGGGLATDLYTHFDGSLQKPIADLTRWGIWGSSSANYLAPEIATLAPTYGAISVNMAKGGELGNHTIARLGVRPFKITVPGGEIPGTTTPLVVEVTNSIPNQFMRLFTGYLNGVRGNLSSTEDAFSFTRAEAGDPVSSPDEYEFLPTVGPDYRDKFIVFWMGKNDASNNTNHEIGSVEAIVQTAVESMQWTSPLQKRAVVLGHFSNRNAWQGNPTAWQKIEAINAQYQELFGNLYVNVPDYLYSAQIWIDVGITPNEDDLLNQANRCLALSLSRDTGGHLSEDASMAVAVFVVNHIKNLGWIQS